MVAGSLSVLANDMTVYTYTATPYPKKLDYRTWLNISIRCGTKKQMVFARPLLLGIEMFVSEGTHQSTLGFFVELLLFFCFFVLPTMPVFLVLTATMWRASKIWPALIRAYSKYCTELSALPSRQFQYRIFQTSSRESAWDVESSGIEVAATTANTGTSTDAVTVITQDFADSFSADPHVQSSVMTRVYADIAFLTASDSWDRKDAADSSAGTYNLRSRFYYYRNEVLFPIGMKAWGQFYFLCLDLIACFPFAVVVMTLYRLLPFVIDAIAKSGAKPLTDVKPLFTVMNMKVTFTGTLGLFVLFGGCYRDDHGFIVPRSSCVLAIRI